MQFQYFCKVENLFKVPAGAFFPVPNVDSAVVKFTFKNESELESVDEVYFRKLVRQSFSMRRKTLRNNLKPFLVDESKISVDLSRRSETLSVSEFVKLSNELQNQKS